MIVNFQEFPLKGKQFLVRAKIEPPFRFNVPMPDEACFYFVTSGIANVYTPTEKIELQNEGIVLQCGSYLNEYLLDNDCEYCEAIAVHLYPEILTNLYGNKLPDFLLEMDQQKVVGYELINTTEIIKSYINSLEFYFENPSLVDEEILKLKAKELLLILAKTNKLDIIRSVFKKELEPKFYEFKQIIERNLYNDLGIPELAHLSNMSISSFKRKFKQLFNESPAKYIKTKKLEKAEELLKQETLNISDVAYTVGFSDLPHFSRSFQSMFNISPSMYKKSQNTK